MEELKTILQEPTIKDITQFLTSYSIGEPDRVFDLAVQIYTGKIILEVTVGETTFSETISLFEAIGLENKEDLPPVLNWNIIPSDTLQETTNPLP